MSLDELRFGSVGAYPDMGGAIWTLHNVVRAEQLTQRDLGSALDETQAQSRSISYGKATANASA